MKFANYQDGQRRRLLKAQEWIQELIDDPPLDLNASLTRFIGKLEDAIEKNQFLKEIVKEDYEMTKQEKSELMDYLAQVIKIGNEQLKKEAVEITPLAPITNSTSNNTTKTESYTSPAYINKCFKSKSSNGNPMEVIVFVLPDGFEVKGYLTWSMKSFKFVYNKFLKPLGLEHLDELAKAKAYDYTSLIGTEVKISYKEEGKFQTVEKILEVLSTPDDELPF